MLFHVFLTREFDGSESETYRGAFQSETQALVNLADALGFYAGASGRVQFEGENGDIISVRHISPAVHPFEPGDVGYVAPQNRVSATDVTETLESLRLEPGDVATIERVGHRRLLVRTTDGRTLRVYDVDRAD